MAELQEYVHIRLWDSAEVCALMSAILVIIIIIIYIIILASVDEAGGYSDEQFRTYVRTYVRPNVTTLLFTP